MQSSPIFSILISPWHPFQKLIWKKSGQSQSQNWTKWGKNDELFIQIGIIFVKKASSISFSKHFHDTCDTFSKSSAFVDFRSKIQNYAFFTKNWENQYSNCFGLSFSNRGSTILRCEMYQENGRYCIQFNCPSRSIS